jgi:hypothetical protein
MRGLCRSGCGCMLEYDSYQFSDGFEYLFPKDLDGKPHHCVIFTVKHELEREGLEISDMKALYQSHKKRLNISYEEFTKFCEPWGIDGDQFFGPQILSDVMGMLRYGRLDELIQQQQQDIKFRTFPFLKSRQFLPTQDEPINLMPKGKISRNDPSWGMQKEREKIRNTLKLNENKLLLPEEMCWKIMVILPTDNGYQLEYLGFYYELMTKFEDAKKCYDLQYQFTEEPELLEKSNELEKKIKRKDQYQKSIDDVTLDSVRKETEHTELNLRKYIHELFSNDLGELFKKIPNLRKDVRKIRNKERDSMLEVEENSDIDAMTLGNLLHILKTSRTRKKAWSDGQCKTCGMSWVKKDEFFSEKYPIEINCADEICFKKQGGWSKNIPQEMIDRVQRIRDFRNQKDHILKAQDPQMLKYVLKETFEICNIVNLYIEKFLVKNQSI